MLHNVADLTDVLSNMADEGLPMPRELVSRLSPYMREHIRRFGQYTTARIGADQDTCKFLQALL